MKAAIYNETAMQKAIGELRSMFKRTGFLRISASEDKDRSHSQNAISHAWYAQISRELGDVSDLDVKCQCKLHYGVPILRAEDDEFREVYDGTIKGMSYEQKLLVMRVLPITSIMTVKQLKQYLEAVQQGYRGTVALEFPPDQQMAHYEREAA